MVYFLYHVLAYRAWGGHAGHLIFGGRVRDLRTGGRISLGQAAVRSLYDIVPWIMAIPMSILAFIFLVAAGDKLDSLILLTTAWAELDPFEALMMVLFWLVRIVHWLAVGCVFIAMGIMVLMRQDRRHAFDLLARVIAVRNPATAWRAGDSEFAGDRDAGF